jgi:hypothetical protein
MRSSVTQPGRIRIRPFTASELRHGLAFLGGRPYCTGHKGRCGMLRPAYLRQKLTRPLPTKDGGVLWTVADARA